MKQSKIISFNIRAPQYDALVIAMDAMRRKQGVKGRPLSKVPLLSDGETRVRFVRGGR